jgi:hypothetical protein
MIQIIGRYMPDPVRSAQNGLMAMTGVKNAQKTVLRLREITNHSPAKGASIFFAEFKL